MYGVRAPVFAPLEKLIDRARISRRACCGYGCWWRERLSQQDRGPATVRFSQRGLHWTEQASLTRHDNREFESIFTPDKPVIFNFHSSPWLIHRLTYRLPGQHNIHVRDYQEKGNISRPLELAIQNQPDRFSTHTRPSMRSTGCSAFESPPPASAKLCSIRKSQPRATRRSSGSMLRTSALAGVILTLANVCGARPIGLGRFPICRVVRPFDCWSKLRVHTLRGHYAIQSSHRTSGDGDLY